MLIEQSKSIGESFNALSNKNVKAFLFTGTIPATQAEIPFDPTNVADVYTNSVGAVETQLTYDNVTGKIQFRPNPDKSGLHFKGTGPDISRNSSVYWCVPTSFSTNRDIPDGIKFHFTNILQSSSASADSYYIDTLVVQTNDHVEFGFEYVADIDGIDFNFPTASAASNFTIQYWDIDLEQYVDITTIDINNNTQRLEFGSTYNTNSMRIVFNSTSVFPMRIDYIRFFSNNTSPTTNFDAAAPVTWCMLFFDLVGHGADTAMPGIWPFMWMDVGSALAPAEFTLASTTINPAQPARMIFCEIEGNNVEDI